MKLHTCPRGFSDPVGLEKFNGLRPVERIEFIDESLGVFRDSEHPLAERSALNGMAFGFPLFDFFVGKHSAEVG